jgi:hypothetical protein
MYIYIYIYRCDDCGKPTYKYVLYHIGSYAEEVQNDMTAYFCENCFYNRCEGQIERMNMWRKITEESEK